MAAVPTLSVIHSPPARGLMPVEQRRLHHSPHPRHQLTLLRDHVRQARLLTHEPQACSTCTKGSNTRPCCNPVNGHPALTKSALPAAVCVTGPVVWSAPAS